MSKSIVISGRQNLYRVAVDNYADPLKFITILQTNILETPFIATPTTVVIVDTPTQTGGVPTQPSGIGTGIVQATATDPFTVELIEGTTITRFPRGTIESRTTGIGNKHG